MNTSCRIQLIGAACGLGAPDPLCAEGPERVRSRLIARGRLRETLAWRETIRVDASDASDADLRAFARKLGSAVSAVCAADQRFVVLGGDHSCAVGTWSGAAEALAARGPLGLIWIDAHMDAHTPRTSPSGNRHGMPLATLLGYGDDGARPAVLPQHLCLIGVRAFEVEEEQLLRRLGVRIYRSDEVLARGIDSIMEEALQRATSGTAGFGLSIDLDAVDPEQAPAVTTPVPNGIGAQALLNALARAVDEPALIGVEIAEYNPHRDREARTGALIEALIDTIADASAASDSCMSLEQRYCARNYAPLPVVLTRGQGVHVWDRAGRRYIDMMSAYSAVSLGHAHPRLVQALSEQARRLGVVSRAYYSDRLGPLARRLCELTGFDRMLPMNTGAEAVETALKAARKWAYTVKGVAEDRAQIIHCAGNFHGRTIAVIGMSSEAQYRHGFGPFAPGFVAVPYGDAAALERAITPDTAAFLVEPIQGEGGIVLPPPGYLAECARLCREHRVLLLCDEVQTGLGRTGSLLACRHERVQPDGIMLGKALGGGLLPISAFLAREELMNVFTPGDHGSTFGGNPLACAVALETLDILVEGGWIEHAAFFGDYLLHRLQVLRGPLVRAIRGRGLFVGVELEPGRVGARRLCEILLRHGILTKDTHETVLRFAPPLIITREQIDEAVLAIARAFDQAAALPPDDEGPGRRRLAG